MNCAFDRTTEAEHVPFAAQRDPRYEGRGWLACSILLALDVPSEKRTEVS